MSGSVVPPGASIAPAHSWAYRQRRAFNWFPLGLTYATYYMGRYNLNVVTQPLGETYHLDKTQIGFIGAAGFWTYALSIMFNGPLADRIGGKKAILIGASGAAILNLCMGLLFLNGWQTHVLAGMCLLYAANCYFQSFGALSVIKVNAPWFHVRERGVFGGVFGIMISAGYALALVVGSFILASFKSRYGLQAGIAFVFIVPAAALVGMALIDWIAVRDTPGLAGYPDFDTGDASSGDEQRVSMGTLIKRVWGNRIIVRIALAEFCTGAVRQGLLFYFFPYLTEVQHVVTGSRVAYWAGYGPTIGGIIGGLACGALSDKLFDSRRPPVAFIFYIGQIVALIGLGYAPTPIVAAFLIGFSCMWIFGVHGMLTGTASMDFGGRKAAASAAGLLDGVQYVASGFSVFGVGWIIKTYGWGAWTWSLVPFSFIGSLIMLTLWNEKPRAAARLEPAPALAVAVAE